MFLKKMLRSTYNTILFSFFLFRKPIEDIAKLTVNVINYLKDIFCMRHTAGIVVKCFDPISLNLLLLQS